MSARKRNSLAAMAAGLALVTLVSGCGGSGAATTTKSATGSGKQIELTVQTMMGVQAEVLANVDTEFTAKYPNVKITLKEGRGGPPDQNTTATALDGVDVVLTNSDQVATLVSNKLLKDLSAVKLPVLNDAVAGIFGELGKVDGTRYALPVAISPSMIAINEQQITKTGQKVPTADWTWQDFMQLLTATKAAGVTNQVTLQAILDPMLRAYGGQVYDADKQQFVFGTAEAKQALSVLQPYVKSGAVQSTFGGGFDVRGGGGPNNQNAPAFMAFGDRGNFMRGGQTSTLPYPKGPKGRPSPATATVAGVVASSANADMAMEYVKELLGNSAEQVALAKGGIRPVTNDAKALAAWQQAVGDANAKAIEAALPDAYIQTQIPNQNDVLNGLLPYLNGTAALDTTVSSLINTLSK